MLLYIRWPMMFICLIFLASCGRNFAPTQTASPELTQSVLAQTVPNGKARIFFYLGRIDGNMMYLGTIDIQNPSDLQLDGKTISSVNYEEIAVVDVEPGEYKMAWKNRSTAEEHAPSDLSVVKLKAGQSVYLRADKFQTTTANAGPITFTNSYSSSLHVCYSDCRVDLSKYKLVVSP